MHKQVFLSDEEIYPKKEDLNFLKSKSSALMVILTKNIKANKIKADIFIGGSYAKGTLAKQKEYDIDVFVRFLDSIDIEKLERAVKATANELKINYERIHGSRDYFSIAVNTMLVFEIVPVMKISKPKEAVNSTDLSYFHVNYIRKKLKNKKLIREILLAKTFMKGQEVYGAESWIHGFSGYSIECLIIYYKSLHKMLAAFIKAAESKKMPIVIDIEKDYKNTHEVLINMNESKRKGPIVFVDPTWKERNVLGALDHEAFEKTVGAAKKYLKNPSKEYFVKKEFDKNNFIDLAERKKATFMEIRLETQKQSGDIAGAKLIKASNYILQLLSKRLEIIESKIIYGLEQSASIYFVARAIDDRDVKGPSVKLTKHAEAFKKEHPKSYIKNGHLYYTQSKVEDVKVHVRNVLEFYSNTLKEMDMINIEIN